jgi:hypothetical protein
MQRISDIVNPFKKTIMPGEKRSQPDRRKNKLSMRSLLFGGRRETLRRYEDRQNFFYVDRYRQSLFGVIVLILFLSVIDAILTLFLINHGAIEINPIMAFYLEVGPYTFLFVKYALTSVGLVVLVIFRNIFLKPIKIHVGSFIYFILLAFLGVVSWQIFLIHRVVA